MAQMAPAVGALDLNPRTIWIEQMRYCAWYLLVKCWPTATGVKLIVGPVTREEVTDEGVKKLQQALPNLQIIR